VALRLDLERTCLTLRKVGNGQLLGGVDVVLESNISGVTALRLFEGAERESIIGVRV